MLVKKYEKKSNGLYKVYIDDDNYLISEEVIIKYKLLYKKEISLEELENILNETNYYDIYNKCIKYISYRIRSKYEIRNYLNKYKLDYSTIENIIEKLEENNLINDEIFVKAFINDKINFTTSGPYKIKLELMKHNIDKYLIDKYLDNIDKELIYNKISKIVEKNLKNKKYPKGVLKNKIYKTLINNGYYNDDIVYILNKYEF